MSAPVLLNLLNELKKEDFISQTVYAIKKLLEGFNVQPRIGMNLSFI